MLVALLKLLSITGLTLNLYKIYIMNLQYAVSVAMDVKLLD